MSALFMQAEQSAWSTRIYDDVSVLSTFKFHSEQAILVKKRRTVLLTFLLVSDLIYCCSLFNILNAGKKRREREREKDLSSSRWVYWRNFIGFLPVVYIREYFKYSLKHLF